VIEFLTEAIELTLLSSQIGSRWASGFRFQSAMHALVTTILLGFARLDKLWQDAEPDPPGRQL
jgi:hypothetical protein